MSQDQIQNKTTIDQPKRSFVGIVLKSLAAVWAVAITYPVIRYLAPHTRKGMEAATSVNLGPVTLQPGESKPFEWGPKPGLLVHTKEGEWKAFNGVCTHLGCTVAYHDNMGKLSPDHAIEGFFCFCHNGVYDINGTNIAGPPPQPLEELNVNIAENGDITVSVKS